MGYKKLWHQARVAACAPLAATHIMALLHAAPVPRGCLDQEQASRQVPALDPVLLERIVCLVPCPAPCAPPVNLDPTED